MRTGIFIALGAAIAMGVSAELSGRSEALALFKRAHGANGVCDAGYYACPPEFGGCCLNGRMCATVDCPPTPMMVPPLKPDTGSVKDVVTGPGNSANIYDGGFIPYTNDNLPDPNYVATPADIRSRNVWSIVGVVVSGIFLLAFLSIFAFICIGGRRNTAVIGPKGVTRKPVPNLPTPVALGSYPAPSSSGPGIFGKAKGLFGGGKGGKPKGISGEKGSGSEYANLNQPDTPGHDERLMAPSPPPTPAPSYGWGSNKELGGDVSDTSYRNKYAPPTSAPPNYTSEPASIRPSMPHTETDSFLGDRSGKPSGKKEADGKLFKGQRTSWDDNFPDRPSYEQEDEGRGRYDPDSRSGY